LQWSSWKPTWWSGTPIERERASNKKEGPRVRALEFDEFEWLSGSP
jgi:hypothetical protein